MKHKKPQQHQPPADLTKEAAELWQRLYEEQEWPDSAALMLLGVLAQQWDRWQHARRKVDETGGPVIAGRFAGTTVANPWTAIEKDSVVAVGRLFRLLGYDTVPAGAIGRPPGAIGKPPGT